MTEERRGQEGGGEDVPQEIAEIVNARAIFNTMNHPEPETFLIGESRNRGFERATGCDGMVAGWTVGTKRAVKNRHRPGLIGLINANERTGENSNISPRPREHFYTDRGQREGWWSGAAGRG